MKQTLILSTAILTGWLGWNSTSDAQVVIRAPFVRVAVGDGGVAVRAPFVRVSTGGAFYGAYAGYPPPIYTPGFAPPIVIAPPVIAPSEFQPPAPRPLPRLPQPKEELAPPLPLQPVDALTLEQFAKTFQPKAGSYEVTILNPVTKQPTKVRFALPEGTPRRVHTNRDSIEFIYGLRQFVRIEFDKDGAMITSR